MTLDRKKLSLRTSVAALLLSGTTLLAVTGCSSITDAIPGHKEAEFRNRVEHDSFPNAAEAVHSQSADK
jgi:hypothetical protein